MGCARISLSAARLKKKYPLVRNVPKSVYATEGNAEIENLLLEINNSDVVIATFDTPFSGIPNIVTSFISVSPVGAPNIFVETASTTSATIRTSAPVTGFISVQAMYIEGCPSQDYTFVPIVLSPPVLGPPVVGNNLNITPPVIIGNPTP